MDFNLDLFIVIYCFLFFNTKKHNNCLYARIQIDDKRKWSDRKRLYKAEQDSVQENIDKLTDKLTHIENQVSIRSKLDQTDKEDR